MQLCEQETNWEFKNNLPGLVLPCPVSHSKAKSKNIKDDKMETIKRLLGEMKNNDYWTTNFASILYIEEKDFQKVLMEDIIEEIKKNFKLKKKIFLSSRTKKPFESVSSVVRSVSTSIKRNKAFIIDKINNQQYISLDLQNVLDYLNKMYYKYTNDGSDITSGIVDNLLVICHTVDSRLRTDNTANAIKIHNHHRINHPFFVFNTFQYIAKKTITIHTNTARDNVAHIHTIQIIKATTDRIVFCLFLILLVKNRQTSGKNATKKYQ
jgi:hypothetical protein